VSSPKDILNTLKRGSDPCKVCASNNRGLSTEQYTENIKAKNIDAFPEEDYQGQLVKILHSCSEGHSWLAKPNWVMQGNGCNICSNKRIRHRTHEQYIAELKEKNIDAIPLEPYVKALLKIPHTCSKGHIPWLAKPVDILSGESSCNVCHTSGKRLSNEEYKAKLIEIKSTVSPLEPFKGLSVRIWHRCTEGHRVSMSPRHGLNCKGNPCTACTGNSQRLTTKKYKKRLREMVPRKVGLCKGEIYVDSKTPLKHYCLEEGCGKEFYTSPSSVMHQGTGCIDCFGSPLKSHDKYLEELFSKGIKSVPLEKYAGFEVKLLHKCPSNHVWKTTPHTLLYASSKYHGCPDCAGVKSLTTAEVNLKLTDKKRSDVIMIGASKGLKTEALFKCTDPNCSEEFKAKPHDVLYNNHGCTSCAPTPKPTTKQYILWLSDKNIRLLDDNGFINSNTFQNYQYLDCGCVRSQTYTIIRNNRRVCPCKLVGSDNSVYKYKLMRLKSIEPLEPFVDVHTKLRHRYLCCGKVVKMSPARAFSKDTCSRCGANCNK